MHILKGDVRTKKEASFKNDAGETIPYYQFTVLHEDDDVITRVSCKKAYFDTVKEKRPIEVSVRVSAEKSKTGVYVKNTVIPTE